MYKFDPKANIKFFMIKIRIKAAKYNVINKNTLKTYLKTTL